MQKIININYNSYISTFYCNDKMYTWLLSEVDKGNLKSTNSLFTTEKQNYIFYVLDVKNFDNLLSIRNKYIHSEFSRKSKSDKLEIHKINYIKF